MTENQEQKQMREVQAFMNILSAAIQDAAQSRKMSQMITEVQPKGMTVQRVRIVIVPETMDRSFSQPLQAKEDPKLVLT